MWTIVDGRLDDGRWVVHCGSTDSDFFCSRHPISIKTGSLKFSNK
jgi:hypothetical protein